MSICNKCLTPRIISSANKSTTQDTILHFIFSSTQVLGQTGFGGGSPVLAITVELGSAVLWDRETVPEGRSLHDFGDCLEKQTENSTKPVLEAYIPKEIDILINIEPYVYHQKS